MPVTPVELLIDLKLNWYNEHAHLTSLSKTILIKQDKNEAAIAPLMIALPAVVAAPLPM